MPNESLEARVRSLEARIEDLEANAAIVRLKARYGELADRRYGPGGPKSPEELEPIAQAIAQLFTEDAVWDGGPSMGLCHGRAAIAQRFAKPTLEFSWHFFVKPQISVEGDRARGVWDVFAPCTLPGGRQHWMTGVEYDEYARSDGEWLHTRMRLDPVFMAPFERGWRRK